jgi:hypothetical protein
VQWEQKRLPTTTEPGYGERVLPANELVKQDVSARPTIVWFYSVEDDRANQVCEGTIFQNEQIGLSLKRFRCVRIDVDEISDSKLRTQYDNTPSFVVYDPKGETVAKLEGRSATSTSRFSGMVRQAWGKLFTMKQKDFVKSMTKILDRMDRVSSQQQVLTAKKQRAEKKGNRAKLAAIAREEAELNAVLAEVQDDETAILERCQLRAEYREAGDEVASAK